MNKLRLDCFNLDKNCQITSSDQAFFINHPLDNELYLEIINHSNLDCLLTVTANNFSLNDDLKLIDLNIARNQEIFFDNGLLSFLTSNNDFALLPANATTIYHFYINPIDLILENKQISTGFDLVFDFICEEPAEIPQQIVDLDDSIQNSLSTSSMKVLSAAARTSDSAKLISPLFQSWHFYTLLSILFVIIFFVIMKFVNGKKKKKTKNTL